MKSYPVLPDARLGSIITIRNDGVPFDEYGLVDLIATTNPEHLDPIAPGKSIARLPSRSDVLLRWNASEDPSVIKNPVIPCKVETLVGYLTAVEREWGRLQRLGARLLRRNVYVVTKDPYEDQEPVIYTAVEAYGNGRNLRDLPPAEKNHPNVQRTLMDVAATHAAYYNVPLQRRILTDLGPEQCAEDGTKYDYDPYLAGGKEAHATAVNYLAAWSGSLIQNTPEGRAIKQGILQLQARLQ